MKRECNSCARTAREYRSRRNSRSSSRPSSSCNSGPDYSRRPARPPKRPLSRCWFSKGIGSPCWSGKRSEQTPEVRLLARLVRAIFGRIWRNRLHSHKAIGPLPPPSQGALKRRRENLFSLAWLVYAKTCLQARAFPLFEESFAGWLPVICSSIHSKYLATPQHGIAPKMRFVRLRIIQGIMQSPALFAQQGAVNDQGRHRRQIPQFEQVDRA